MKIRKKIDMMNIRTELTISDLEQVIGGHAVYDDAVGSIIDVCGGLVHVITCPNPNRTTEIEKTYE